MSQSEAKCCNDWKLCKPEFSDYRMRQNSIAFFFLFIQDGFFSHTNKTYATHIDQSRLDFLSLESDT